MKRHLRTLTAGGLVAAATATMLLLGGGSASAAGACDTGSRAAATDLAESGVDTVQESRLNGGTYDGLTVALRFSTTVSGCAWGLVTGPSLGPVVGFHEVWIDRSPDDGLTWEKSTVTSTRFPNDVTHTGVYDASYPYSVRACAQSEYVTVEEDAQYDAGAIVCTDWWGT